MWTARRFSLGAGNLSQLPPDRKNFLQRNSHSRENKDEQRNRDDNPDNPTKRFRDGRRPGKLRDEPHHEADDHSNYQERDEPSQQRTVAGGNKNRMEIGEQERIHAKRIARKPLAVRMFSENTTARFPV